MTEKKHTQVAVIGAGPGGYAAAFRAADLGSVMPPKTTYFLPKARSGVLIVSC